MEISFEDENINGGIRNIEIDKLPERCPFCHELANPTQKGVNLNSNQSYISDSLLVYEIFFICSNKSCQKAFIGYYKRIGNNDFELINLSKGFYVKTKFSAEISSVSPKFEQIYNQASAAEQDRLFEICGSGYRKALEFLIKDYAISKNANKRDIIEGTFLGNCIDEYIADINIKNVSKRAAWLGNDESHFVRDWEGKNLTDLKRLLELTVNWIKMEIRTKDYENDMPKQKKHIKHCL